MHIAVIIVIGAILISLPFVLPQLLLESMGYMLAFKPDDYEGWRYYGTLLEKKGMDERAHYALKKAVALRPDYKRAWVSLGDFYSRIGEQEKASEAYEMAYARNLEDL